MGIGHTLLLDVHWPKGEGPNIVMKADIIGKSNWTTLTRTPTLYLKRIKICMVLYEEEVVATDPYSSLDRKLQLLWKNIER